MRSARTLTLGLLVGALAAMGCSKLEAESGALPLTSMPAASAATGAPIAATGASAALNGASPASGPAASSLAQATHQAPAPAGSVLAGIAHEIERSCGAICARSATLHCGQSADCEQDCVVAAAGTPCTAAFLHLYACLEREPLSHWECADGAAAIREGFCDEQQSAAAHCVEAQPHSDSHTLVKQ